MAFTSSESLRKPVQTLESCLGNRPWVERAGLVFVFQDAARRGQVQWGFREIIIQQIDISHIYNNIIMYYRSNPLAQHKLYNVYVVSGHCCKVQPQGDLGLRMFGAKRARRRCYMLKPKSNKTWPKMLDGKQESRACLVKQWYNSSNLQKANHGNKGRLAEIHFTSDKPAARHPSNRFGRSCSCPPSAPVV